MSRVSPKVLALLAALTLVWGTNWPLFRIALDELPVWTFRTMVLATAAIVLTAILLVRRENFAVPRNKWPALILASAMNIGVWNIATSLAVLYIPSGHASVLAYTMPLWVAVLGLVVFGQKLTGRLLAALAIGAGATLGGVLAAIGGDLLAYSAAAALCVLIGIVMLGRRPAAAVTFEQ